MGSARSLAATISGANGMIDGGTFAEIDPVSRIEGHLGVKVGTAAGYVDKANVHGNMWRGFENFLLGREPNDAITFTEFRQIVVNWD